MDCPIVLSSRSVANLDFELSLGGRDISTNDLLNMIAKRSEADGHSAWQRSFVSAEIRIQDPAVDQESLATDR